MPLVQATVCTLSRHRTRDPSGEHWHILAKQNDRSGAAPDNMSADWICRQNGGSVSGYQTGVAQLGTMVTFERAHGRPYVYASAPLEETSAIAAFRVVWGTLSLPGGVVLR